MHRWFIEYMQSELERLLRDPFNEICDMLDEETPFSFSRFGDGEFSAIFGIEGKNSDGHRYFPELGDRLRGILRGKPDYMMGLQTHAVLVHGALPIRSASEGIEWVLADSLHNASMEGKLGRFFDALGDREVVLVGGTHHRQLAENRSWRFVEIAAGDCWPQYEEIRGRLQTLAVSDSAVFLLCASMTANVLIDDLHQANTHNTYIDAGSVLDPYAGVMSRAYHRELDADPLRGIG